MGNDKLEGIEHLFKDFCEFFAGKDFDLFISIFFIFINILSKT